MAQDPTRVIPGDYSATAYDVLSKYDPAFPENVSVEDFFENLQSPEYAAKAYSLLADSDPELVENLSLDEFIDNVKKKDEPVVTESVSDAGSSEQRLASRDLEAERMSAFGAAGGGRVVDSREVPQEGYNSPAEIAKRDSATTAIDTREANIAASQLIQRQEEAQRITAGLPPVTIPEGSVTDALQQLRKVYGPYGLQFSEEKVPAAMTRSGSKVVKATVPKGAGGKPIEVRLELDEDGNIKPSEAEKIDALLRENATYVGETDTSFVEKALKVDQMRPVPRIDSSGVSTVKMASAEVDGKFIAYPTLFPKDPAGTTSTNPNDWMELDFGIEAQDEAFKRGEVFEFDTDEKAKAFAAGAWKDVAPMDLEFQKRHKEMGRDYDADMAFLNELTERRDEYKFIEDLPVPGARYEEGLIPASYQKYFIDGNMVRDDIETMRDEKEAELSMLESQFDEDNVLLRLKEDRDVALGERFEQLSTEAAEINADAKTRQNQLQVESIKNFGVRLEDLATYEPKTEEELRGMIGLYDDYNQAASQRQAAALGYERAQTYYDKQYDKGITQEYVDGWEEVSVAWDNGWKRGEAMSKLLLMQMGYYNVIGDEGAEEQAMREVSEIMDSQDPRRGRLVSRANMTGTTDSYLASIASNPGMYTAAITAESLGQLLPIWAKVLPVAAVGGAIYGGATAGPGGSIIGTLGAVGATALESAFMIGMPISELALEMGNATLEVGERMGYDWSDPNSALKALNDEKLWADATQRGLERGIPIASMGLLSNFFIGAAVGRSASLASTGERVLRGAGTGLIAEPATEALGEYMAIQTTGEYTGSTANFREIMAEAIGAVGMGVSMGTAFGAVGYAKQKLQESNFDLAIKLMDPMVLGAENVSGQRIMNWANKMEKLGQITPEQAAVIRRNTGLRRDANELLGRNPDSRPGTKGKVVGRLMQLLEAKENLDSRGRNAKLIFGKRISEINDEIAYIAENQSLPDEQVNLEGIGLRTEYDKAGAYKFNGKNVSRQDFLNKLQEATQRQLRKALVYNDPAVSAELKAKRDAISKRETTEVPVGKRTGFGSEVDEEVREITQEVINEQSEGKLDEDEIENLLAPIAAKKARGEKLTDLEQQFAETNSSLLKRVEKDLSDLDKLVADPSTQEQEGVSVIGKLTDRGKAVGKQARKAAKALRAAFPEVKIVLHADDASFVEAAKGLGLKGTGRAFYGFKSKEIHVHTGRAKNTTVAHEAFHAALRNSVDKSEVQALMGDFVTTLKKVIPADSELGTKLDKFARDYKENRVDEEYVAEFFGELAAAYPTLDRKGKTAIARFLERLSNLIGIDLTLTPDLTKRDEQILSLLETLAGKVSQGKAIKGKQVSEFQELARSTSRKQTEDNLGAAEQKVDDFSDEQIQAMADEGVIFHFSDVDITKVLPEKLKRFVLGYGFYFTNYALEDSSYRNFGDRITMVNAEDFNLLDGDTAITEEQAKALRSAAKTELQEAEEYGEELGFEESQVLMSLADTKANELWGTTLTAARNDERSIVGFFSDEQKATVARLIQEMLGFDGVVYGQPMTMGKTGAINIVWNFPKIDRAIIEPGQEPRAAEQRVSRIDDGPPRFNEDGLPEVQAAEQMGMEEATQEWVEENFKNADAGLREFLVEFVKQPGVRLFLNPIGGGFYYANQDRGSTELDVRTSIYMERGLVYLDLLEVFAGDKSQGAGTRFMQDFVAALDASNQSAELLAWPPKWYQQGMSDEEMEAISKRLQSFYSRFGFTPKSKFDDNSMTREPGAVPKERTALEERTARERANVLTSIADTRTKKNVLGHIIAETYDVYSEQYEDKTEFARIDRAVDPYDEGVLATDLYSGRVTAEQIEEINDEYGDGLINEDGFAENFEDFVDSDIVDDYVDLVIEEKEISGRLRNVERRVKEEDEAAGRRERRLGKLEDNTMALEHILAVNEDVYGRTETDVYNQYEAYLEGRLDEADKEYLRSLELGIDVETGEVDNAINLYDVFQELQDVREQRNDLESGLSRAAEQRTIDSTNGTFLIPVESDVSSVAQVGFDPKSETHVTIIGFPNGRKVMRAVKQNPEVEQEVNELIARSDFRFTPTGRAFEIEKEYAAYRDRNTGEVITPAHTRQALIEEVDMPGLAPFYSELSELIGEELAVPYPHISLGTRLDPRGIGINSVAELEALNPKPVTLPQTISYDTPRAAEQRIDIDAVRTRSRAGNRVSKGLATYNVNKVQQVEEIENLTRDYVREQAPKAYIKNANVIAKYPLVRGVREFGEITTVEQADELYDIYTQQTMDNLRWMMETYPDEFSEISTLWYDGANKIANELATEFGVSPEQAAGILAALSPQKDWYQNAHLARLMLEAFADNPVMTRKMVNYQRKFTKGKIAEKKKALKKARAVKGTSKARAKVEKFNKDKARLLNDIEVAEALLDAITALEGTRMMDADPSMMGYFVRLHAETTKPISYQVISPDGEMVGPSKKDDGSTAKWAWGSYNEIGKGVSINLNGSPENITISLGQQHKVRNFFNNIIDPMSTEGDVTMDTHAIAVSLLKPLSTKSAEVEHNFGSKGAASSGAKGIKGTYYANQEAYQMLAEEMGMLPRQIQSVTWEAVRGLFTDKFKGNKKNVKAINQIWENYAEGKITIDEARAQVLERAGGVNPPVWAESVQGESREGVRESRERGADREGGRAAEQRVVEPGVVDVLERYEFKPNKSLKNAELAPELNRNLQRFGYGVKQYGTRMNDFRVVSLDTGRAVDPGKIIAAGVEERAARVEEQRTFEEEQRARELEDRIIEIYEADERPFTGRDFESQAAEQKQKIEAMSQPDDTMRDIVAKGREMGFRDSAIRAVLMKRYGRDSTEAINTALAENADIFTVIPKPFGNVVGGLDVGRQIYAEVRAKLNEFMTPKSPARMTKKQRADRIAELREAHPDQNKVSDSQLLRRFPRPKTTPTRAEMMAEALEILKANRRFKEQPEKVQKELLVGFATSLKSRANKGVQNLLSQIRRDLKERKKGAKTAREVQAQLRTLINEVLPKAEYSKAQVAKLTKVVNEVNEDNYIVKAQKVLDLVEEKREQIRKATIREIIGFVKRSAKTYKTPGGRIRTRGLDAPGRAFFLEANRVLAAVFKKDQTDIMNIGFNLANNPEVDIATAKLMNGENLTVKEQMLIDQKDAYDLFAPLSDMSLEQVEAVLEDLKVTAGFSRLNLKTIRMERAARLNALRQGAKDSVEGNWGGTVTKEVEKDGETKIVAKDRNELATDRANKKSFKDIMLEGGLQEKYRALVEWSKETKRLTPSKLIKNAQWWAHLGTITSVMGEFFNEEVYNKVNRMKEENLRGEYAQKEKLNDIANSIDGITNGYEEITQLIFMGSGTRVLTADEQGLTLSVKAGRRKFTTDELMRIYALSKNPIQRAKLERQGFTNEVMAGIEEFLDPRLTEFVDKTVEYLSNEYYEGVNDVYVKVNDVNLGYMENYFPTRTQFQGDLATQSKDQLLSSTYSGPNSQMASALKERVDTGSDILMNEGLGFHSELGNHINTMERFKAYSVGVQEINAILSDSFTVSLSELLGMGKVLNDGVSAAIMPDVFKSDLDFKTIDKWQSRFVMSALAFKPMQIVKQMTSAIAGVKEYQYGKEKNLPVDILMFSMDFARLLPKLILEGVSLGKYKGPVSTMIEDSATLRRRIEDNFGGDLYGLTSGVSGRTRRVTARDYTLAAKALKGLAQAGGTATSAGDVAGVMGYLPAYMRDIQNGMSKEEAIEKFNQYNKTQQSRREAERAPIQTRQDGVRRLLTAFTSSQLLYLNEVVTTANNMNQSVRKGERIKASDSRGFALALVGYSVMFTLATSMWQLMFGDDEEKEKAWKRVLISPISILYVIPLIGPRINQMANWFTGDDYPTSVVKDPYERVVREVVKSVKDEDILNGVMKATEFRLGTNLDMFRGMMDIAKGQPMDESFYDVMGVPPSQRPESD